MITVGFNSHPAKKLKKNFKNNRFYYGDWVEGLPYGRGIFYQPNRILFESFFINGKPSGQSKILLIDKNKNYEGQVKQGRIEGNGQMIDNKLGYKFEGRWKNSQPQEGILLFFYDKNIERIDFINFDQRIGKIIYRDGRIYEGEVDWNKLVPHGKGQVKFGTFDLKDYYEGEWKNGIYHGAGAFFWKNGEQYIGEYRYGKKHGQGRFKFMTGNQYEGRWADGKQNGQGCLLDKNGFRIKSGIWRQGSCVTGEDRFHHSISHKSSHLHGLNSLQIDKISEQFVNQNSQDILKYDIKNGESNQSGNLKISHLTQQ